MTAEIQDRNDYEIDEAAIPTDGTDDAYAEYRSISKAAVASIAFLVLGLSGLVFYTMLTLAAAGIVFAVLALRSVRQYPDEVSGHSVAILGLIGCTSLLIGGSAMHTYTYLTEVPDGYARISFEELQGTEDPKTGEMMPPKQLDGQRVFVKGYVHPGVSSAGEVKKFILVPDMGTCCFGGQPKMTDMIEVTIVDAPGIRYSQRKRKLGGVLHVSERIRKVAGDLTGGLYELRADYVK
jgi:hypothetical protein